MIFVTGGTGLLGNSIVRELCRRGHAVRVLCRKETSRTAFDGLDVEIVEGDLSDRHVLDSAVSGCTCVIHSAAMIHIGWYRMEPSRRVNVVGTEHVIAACTKYGARMIHVSTVDTLPAAFDVHRPIDEQSTDGLAKTRCAYVVSKVEAEQVVDAAIANANLDAVVLHPGFMLGPFDWKPSSGRMMLEVNRAPIVAAPPGGCSLCDVRDVAHAAVESIQLGGRGEHYILAGENLTYQRLWKCMLQVTGRRRKVYRLGKGIRYVGSLIDCGFRFFPQKEGDVNGAAIAMGSLNHFYDSTKARRELGYRCRPSTETLQDAWEWLSKMQ